MARPKKTTVDYFPHDCNHHKTMFILENKFGNDGYAFWFKLLEVLGQTENHVFDCNNPPDWEFLLAKTRVDEVIANSILQTLVNLDAIDPELWSNRIIWCQKFVVRISDVYARRGSLCPQKPGLCQQKPHSPVVSGNKSTQTKLKETRVKETKEEYIGGQAQKILEYLNQKKGSKYEDDSFIIPRLKEGRTIQECIQIIDNKLQDSYFIENPKYLCPETLFRKSKFDKYLNEVPIKNHLGATTTKNISSLNQWEIEEDERERQGKV